MEGFLKENPNKFFMIFLKMKLNTFFNGVAMVFGAWDKSYMFMLMTIHL